VVPTSTTHARSGPGQGETGYQRPPRRGRESPLSHGEVGRRWSIVDEELPSEVREMWRDLADAMCEKELEPVEVHAERIRRAIVPLITSSYEDAVVRLEDLGALVLACAGRYD